MLFLVTILFSMVQPEAVEWQHYSFEAIYYSHDLPFGFIKKNYYSGVLPKYSV
jgi:hypothetical protein